MSGGIICKMYKSYMTLYANTSMPIQAVQGIEGNEEHAAHPSQSAYYIHKNIQSQLHIATCMCRYYIHCEYIHVEAKIKAKFDTHVQKNYHARSTAEVPKEYILMKKTAELTACSSVFMGF